MYSRSTIFIPRILVIILFSKLLSRVNSYFNEIYNMLLAIFNMCSDLEVYSDGLLNNYF